MNGSLYLFPANAFAAPPDALQVQAVLKQENLISKPLKKQCFLVDDGFFRHISFAGCSPYLQLQPPQDGSDNFTHISLLGPFAQPKLLSASRNSRPRCPHCGQRISDWKSQLGQWQENPAESHTCGTCGKPAKAAALDWRHYAACGRLLVQVHQVFPGEAMPGDSLMKKLAQASGCEWCYGWADSVQVFGKAPTGA